MSRGPGQNVVDPGATLDALFQDAVSALDAGAASTLERLLTAHPMLVRERLESPGAWLRDKAGPALEGFFQRPYLLWFVAEDPVRNGTLPRNIAQLTRIILEAAQRERVATLHDQLDYALRLVAWSRIARECDVQIALIDVLVDAGASPDGNPDRALVNGNLAAAEHLLARGAPVTLATALCLDRWDDARRLAPTTSASDRQFALVLAALNGNAAALQVLIDLGVDVHAVSPDLYPHGSPLHHAVGSGSLAAVKVLVDAGADVGRRDTAWHATPVGWAEYAQSQHTADGRGTRFAEIAAYLRERERRSGQSGDRS